MNDDFTPINNDSSNTDVLPINNESNNTHESNTNDDNNRQPVSATDNLSDSSQAANDDNTAHSNFNSVTENIDDNCINSNTSHENFEKPTANTPYEQQFNSSMPYNNNYPQQFNGQPPYGTQPPQPPVNQNPYMMPPQGYPQPMQPYYSNGRWYYPPQQPAPMYQRPPKKKMALSVKIFLWILCSLLAIMFVGSIVYCCASYSYNNGGSLSGTGGNSSGETNSAITDATQPDLSNPNGPTISFSETPTDGTAGNAQTAYDTLSSSVVAVSEYSATTDQLEGQGTGIIMSSDGYIVTNSHVIGDTKDKTIKVVVKTGEKYDAAVVGFDTRTDIAILKIDATDLTPAVFADSSQLTVGQDVIAIGNPGGIDYSNSLTKGIISALNRTVNSSSVLYIQTDAAINPGNSGGPLANLYGQVVGMNTIKVVDTQYEGMGFAIPSATIKEIADDLIKKGYVANRVRVGITGRMITSSKAESAGVEPGIYIDSIASDSPMIDTDAAEGDIITKIDGETVTSFSMFYSVLAKHSPGDEVTLTIYRPENTSNNSKATTFDVKVKLVADTGSSSSAASATE